MNVQILVFNEKMVATKLTRMGADAVNTRPALENVADFLMERAEGRFASEGRSGGGSWKRLKPETVKRKVASGQSPKILQASGALRRSVTKRNAPGQVLEFGRDTLRFGSDLEYTATHQFGDESRGIPARPFISTSPRDRTQMREIIRDHLMKEWRSGGRV